MTKLRKAWVSIKKKIIVTQICDFKSSKYVWIVLKHLEEKNYIRTVAISVLFIFKKQIISEDYIRFWFLLVSIYLTEVYKSILKEKQPG